MLRPRKNPEGEPEKSADRPLERLLAALLGGFLALAILKFGNPPIMERFATWPTNAYEFVLGFPWPISWAYGMLASLLVIGLFSRPWRGLRVSAPRWLVCLPLAWFAWQLLAATQSIDPQLTRLTLKHFLANLACLYLGLLVLSRMKSLWAFWIPVLLAFLFMLAAGWAQHLGGLEETREYFFLYVYPQLKEVSPDYLKKISSDRIFATMFYPNALAGALLLLLPPLLVVVCRMRQWLSFGARTFLAGAISLASLTCLFWSGSKGGWLLALVLGVVVLLRLPLSRTLKGGLLAGLLVAGLAGFFWKYSGFFQRGATSVSARFDYWEAALSTLKAKPLLGSGPGTFGIAYALIKTPESEPARLAHNDYLQQASDSGIAGFLLYTTFIIGALVYTWRSAAAGAVLLPSRSSSQRSATQQARDVHPTADLERWQTFAVWLGVLGFCLQTVIEFGLYLPALAWPAFTFLGWLMALPGAAQKPRG